MILDAVTPLTPEQFTRQVESSFKSVRDTVAHIYAADLIWYTRWQGQSPTSLLSYDSFPDVASIRHAWVELEGKVRAFVDELGEAGVSRVFEYKLMSGAAGSSPFWQMLGARRQSRQLPPRPGDDAAAAAGRAAAEKHRHDHVLSGRGTVGADGRRRVHYFRADGVSVVSLRSPPRM